MELFDSVLPSGGRALCEAKIRVMDGFFLVLLRYYLFRVRCPHVVAGFL